MPERTTTPNLLEAVYAVGQQMCSALHADDLETFFGLVQERGTLLEKLHRYAHPAEIDPNWERTAAALAQQQTLLNEALADQEQRMSEALHALERFKDARTVYAQRPARGVVLNPVLQG
jgi:hypothetical protein